MNNKLPDPDLDYTGALELDLTEATLMLHALRSYMSGKGAEISEGTRLLESKLESFIDRRLGYEKLVVETVD